MICPERVGNRGSGSRSKRSWQTAVSATTCLTVSGGQGCRCPCDHPHTCRRTPHACAGAHGRQTGWAVPGVGAVVIGSGVPNGQNMQHSFSPLAVGPGQLQQEVLYDAPWGGSSQFSSGSSGIRAKWAVLFVTTVNPWRTATPAMKRSLSPIGLPVRRKRALKRPDCSAAGSSMRNTCGPGGERKARTRTTFASTRAEL
jgi:hypothetical protein